MSLDRLGTSKQGRLSLDNSKYRTGPLAAHIIEQVQPEDHDSLYNVISRDYREREHKSMGPSCIMTIHSGGCQQTVHVTASDNDAHSYMLHGKLVRQDVEIYERAVNLLNFPSAVKLSIKEGMRIGDIVEGILQPDRTITSMYEYNFMFRLEITHPEYFNGIPLNPSRGIP